MTTSLYITFAVLVLLGIVGGFVAWTAFRAAAADAEARELERKAQRAEEWERVVRFMGASSKPATITEPAGYVMSGRGGKAWE